MHICKKTFLRKRTYYISLISSLLLLFNLFIVSSLADTGGHFILPELSGTITIDDEDAPMQIGPAPVIFLRYPLHR